MSIGSLFNEMSSLIEKAAFLWSRRKLRWRNWKSCPRRSRSAGASKNSACGKPRRRWNMLWAKMRSLSLSFFTDFTNEDTETMSVSDLNSKRKGMNLSKLDPIISTENSVTHSSFSLHHENCFAYVSPSIAIKNVQFSFPSHSADPMKGMR